MVKTLLTTVLAVVAWGLLGFSGSWAGEPPTNDSSLAEVAPGATLNDAQLAAWLIIESGVQDQVRQFAAEHSETPAVKLQLISTLEVARNHASPELRAKLDSSLSSVKDRVRQNGELMQQVASSEKG